MACLAAQAGLALFATATFAAPLAQAAGLAPRACTHATVEAGAGPARWTDVGVLSLADGRSLAAEGIALPTRLSPDPQMVTLAARATAAALDGCVVAPGPGAVDRHGRITGPARLVCGAAGATRHEDLATALARSGAGYATADGDAACAEARRSAEAEARRAGRGIWSAPASVLAAADAPAVAERTGLFSLVEGRVLAAGGRDRVFLNFGASWKQDFTVMLTREDFATILGDRLDPAHLRGSLIQVRGVVREEGGPAMSPRRRGEVLRIGDWGEIADTPDAEAPPSRRRAR